MTSQFFSSSLRSDSVTDLERLVGSFSDPTSATDWALWSQRDVCLPLPSRSMLTQSLMSIAVPAPPLSSSLSMTISPNVTKCHQPVSDVLSLSPFPLPLSLSLFMHCWTKCTLLTVTLPPHGPTGSFTHPVVQLVFFVHVKCSCSGISFFSFSSLHPGMREHPPIPVVDLADHIERLKANDGLRFSQEYEVRAAR